MKLLKRFNPFIQITLTPFEWNLKPTFKSGLLVREIDWLFFIIKIWNGGAYAKMAGARFKKKIY